MGDVCEPITDSIDTQKYPNEVFAEYSMPAFDASMKPDIVLGSSMNSVRKIITRPCLLVNKLNVRKKRIWYVKKPNTNAVCSAEFIPLHSDTVDLTFLNQVAKSETFTRYLENHSSGSSNSQKRITPRSLMLSKLHIPPTEEQKLIGKIFESLDHTITLHEDKKRQLERIKSALLQKMFANKSEYPAIRFEGFSAEWEQCKLGDVCEEVSGNNGNVKGLPILTISAANGWMNQKDRFSQVIAGNELKKYTLLEKGHLAYNHGNSKQAKYGTVFVQNLYDQALVPRVYHSFKMKTENNPYYVEYYFATKKLDRELARLVTSGARMDGLLNINKKDFFKIKFEVPTSVEQSLISTILQKLDRTITLHDQKLSFLKRLKQTLLQKMFI